ncbi:MAG: PQQ-binding-like beta-propeller repeat protein [Gemmataceae bacterium]
MSMTMREVTYPLTLAAALALPVLTAHGDDWPMQGRDATRNAVSPEKGAPTHWQVERLRGGVTVQPGWNVRWVARLGSANLCSPVVAGGLVWVGTNNDSPRDPRHKQDASVLMCFRESDGQFLWQYVSPRLGADFEDFPRAPISCSPLVEGDRLYFTTNRGEVVCFDLAGLRAGKGEPVLLWKLDTRKELGVRLFGHSMIGKYTCSLSSTYKGRLYVSTGNGVGEDMKTVAAPGAPSLVCLDARTGKVLWSDRSPGKDIILAQWSSPLVAEFNGRGQVMAAQGDGWLRSFDALTGELLWKFDLNPKKAKPYRPGGGGEKNFPVAPPVLYEGRVYLAAGQDPDDGAGVGHLWCIDPPKAPTNKEKDVTPVGDNFDPKDPINKDSALAWHYGGPVVPRPKDDEREWHFGRTLSSVAIHGGLVIAPEANGYVHCLDARTGKCHWVADVESAIRASPLIADGKVYVPTDDDRVWVFALSAEKRLLARNEGAYGRSGLTFANGTLYQATGSRLWAIGAPVAEGRAPGHWPQWRGADRRNVSHERGLLKRWPENGPPLAWRAKGLGDCPGTVAVAGGTVYALGYVGDEERVTALDEADGKARWAARIGPAVKENSVMRWLSQRTPLVEGDRLYAVTARGDLVCLRTPGGKELWRKSYVKDFEGKSAVWGFCDHLLVDDDRLVVVPGGKKATVAVLNKKTGATVWTRAVPGGDTPHYGATVLSRAGGVPHYIVVLGGGLAGVRAGDGKLLWRYPRIGNPIGNCYAPIVVGDQVFCASGYGRGVALLSLKRNDDGLDATEEYYQARTLPPWHETTIEHEGYVYAGATTKMVCLEMATGKVLWEARGAVGGTYAVTCADGRLYLRDQFGRVALVEATPKGYVENGLFQIPTAGRKPGSTAPVVAGGRLYLRDDDVLHCYDIKEEITPKKDGAGKPGSGGRVPRAAFVPTPPEVVEEMLSLAKVTRMDVVFDLGCGDGRVLVAAAKRYGCQARGFDLDPECVKAAREAVEKEGVRDLVRVEEKDLYAADLKEATVITLYLLARMNEKLVPRLQALRAGTRVVAHEFAIPGMRPDQVVRGNTREGRKYALYLYTLPLRREGE